MKYIFGFILTMCSLFATAQVNFKSGEYLKYRIHYTGLNAGFATLNVKDAQYDGKDHFHIVGKGNSSGAVRAFYKVDDVYETFIDKRTFKPSKFIRNISEGGYTRHQIYYFNHTDEYAIVDDLKRNKSSSVKFNGNVYDLISVVYSMRNENHRDLKDGDMIDRKIFLGDETYNFKVKVLGREVKKTKFGNINTIMIRPYVQEGRVFKASESVTMWISDDPNMIPISIKASLVVGSLNADLYEYKNLKYSINFKN
ncbi:DUF3108 domain-containing protein [Vaginella massiliensis]|uniref:DUF3108 domain-containing protein n=1 Tax=Vaginella massiliensis TaxID=1816680 RepID=UPI0008386257|nr:DUF3108 domain-containing protein [Vaginella massiliensis]